MGFNKRFFSEEKIRSAYKTGGVVHVCSLMYKTDAAICEDDYSNTFVQIYRECSRDKNYEKLEDFLCQ